jgi:hypothetical protein
MAELALLLSEAQPTESEVNLTRILDFFGVPWRQISTEDLFSVGELLEKQRCCLFARMPVAGKLLTSQSTEVALLFLIQNAQSAFIFGADCSAATKNLLRWFSNTAVLTEEREIICRVSKHRRDLCGALSGLEIILPVQEPEPLLTDTLNTALEPIISCGRGSFFSVARVHGIECYLAPSPRIIDLGQPLTRKYFDVADHLPAAVPAVMYIRHQFTEVMFSPLEHGACLIVDDPVLRPRYGFVDFNELSAFTADHMFTSTLAFIPWNWRRSHSSVVNLFRRNSNRLSICYHGCDHTKGEFGSETPESINALVKSALSRMQEHQFHTGLAHDSVMVFPQGIFSSTSLKVLKHNGFTAALNTETSPVDRGLKTTIGEVWNLAILAYWDFAVYTRRYPFHGLHNFAFDLLLGKPCLIVAHHSDFQHGAQDLMDFIDILNKLGCSLTWRTAGEVIRRAFLKRSLGDGTEEIRMFGNEIVVANNTIRPMRILVHKTERSPEGIECINVGGRPVEFAHEDGFVRFSLQLGIAESAVIRVKYKDMFGSAKTVRNLRDQINVLVRRSACELRDEAQARGAWFYEWVGNAFKKRSETGGSGRL